MSKIRYPTKCTTSADKTEFLYLAQETLRLQHNEMGKKFREGKISKGTWTTYRDFGFNPKQEAVIGDILENRRLLKHSTKYLVDLDNLLEK